MKRSYLMFLMFIVLVMVMGVSGCRWDAEPTADDVMKNQTEVSLAEANA
jgi:hypothetical protein